MIPLFMERCVQFIEKAGLDSEGIYRVPGNRAHVELLYHQFDSGKTFGHFQPTLNLISLITHR